MAFSTGGKKGLRNDINVTPLVDVVLVLLIIFMVITPMLQRGKDVTLPKSSAVDEAKKADPLVVSVTEDRRVWIESEEVQDGELEARAAEIFAKNPGKPVMLKGDERLTVGDVRKVMHHVHMAGARGVALAVQERK
jgi:biopolymer transport protein ExbD